MKQTVRVSFFTTTGEPKLDAFVCALVRLLREYERNGSGKFVFEVVDSTSDEARQRVETARMQSAVFGAGDRAVQGVLGLAFSYGTAKSVIPRLYPEEPYGMEFQITNKLRELHDTEHGIKRRIGVVSGKKELGLSEPHLVPTRSGPSLDSIMKQAFPFYAIEAVTLSPGVALDDGLLGLIVTQPRVPYTQAELEVIDEFLMRGGKGLVVYASAVALDAHDARMQASLRATGLEPLLAGYGIQLNTNAVFDFGAPLEIGTTTAGGPKVLRYTGVPLIQAAAEGERTRLDTGFQPFFGVDALPFPFASSLTLLPNRQAAGVKLRGVASTSEESASETTARLNLLPSVERKPKPPLLSRTVAAFAEGRLRSAFATQASSSEVRHSPMPSRVFVVASGLFVANPFAYAGNPSATAPGDQALLLLAQPYTKHLTSMILSFKNTLDWLTGDADLPEVSTKLTGSSK